MATSFPKIHWRWVWNHSWNKKDVKYWISQFNSLRKTITIDTWSFGNHVEFIDLCILMEINSIFLDFWILKFSKNILTGI